MRITSICILATLPLFSSAADWPGWRGPDRTDLSSESGLRTSWPDGGPKQQWVFSNAGVGYSGPAIVDASNVDAVVAGAALGAR